MHVECHILTVTTDGGGACETFTPPVTGRVLQLRYVPDTVTPLEATADLDLAGETTGVIVADKDDIGAAAFTVAPRQATHDTGLDPALYAGGGEPVLDAVVLANERLKLTIAQGGAAKRGTFYLWIG